MESVKFRRSVSVGIKVPECLEEEPADNLKEFADLFFKLPSPDKEQKCRIKKSLLEDFAAYLVKITVADYSKSDISKAKKEIRILKQKVQVFKKFIDEQSAVLRSLTFNSRDQRQIVNYNSERRTVGVQVSLKY